ncbi:MAG TPA: hypothetical protein VGK63_03980 [Candidatus Limnocylindrales bacterium]
MPRLIPRLPVRGARPGLVRPVERVSAEYAFGRSELPAVADALRTHLRDRSRQLGSPDELRRALEEASGAASDGGRVDVRRIPGALHTAESWQVRLESVRPEVCRTGDRLFAEARGVR